jgi:hypothetical protein
LIANYNTNNGTNVVPLPSANYSISTLNVVIPKGQKQVAVPVSIINAAALDPLKLYGIGLTISSVDNNYKIASNYDDLFIIINIKNKYDGVYKLRGVHNRSPYVLDPYVNKTMHLITAGPNSVFFYWPLAGDVGHPINNANSWYGNSVAAALVFDNQPTNTNLITSVYNYPGTAVTFTKGPDIRGASRWVMDTVINGQHKRMIYAEYYYGGNPGANPQDGTPTNPITYVSGRRFSDTLEYVGPRP